MLSASWPACMPISATSPASDEPPLTLRSLARASALFTFANIVPKVGALLLVPIYVRLLSTAEYGTLALATTVIGLLTTVCRLGMDGSLMRLHFDADGPLLGKLHSSVALTTLAIAALVIVVGTGLGLALVSEPILGIDFVRVGILTLLVALTTSLAFIPSVFYRATRQAARFAVFNIGGFLLTSMIVVVLVMVIRLGVAGILLGQLLAGTVLLSFAIFIAVRRRSLHPAQPASCGPALRAAAGSTSGIGAGHQARGSLADRSVDRTSCGAGVGCHWRVHAGISDRLSGHDHPHLRQFSVVPLLLRRGPSRERTPIASRNDDDRGFRAASCGSWTCVQRFQPVALVAFFEVGPWSRLIPAVGRARGVPTIDLPHAEANDPIGASGLRYDTIAASSPNSADMFRSVGIESDRVHEIGPLRYDTLVTAAAEAGHEVADNPRRIIFASQPVLERVGFSEADRERTYVAALVAAPAVAPSELVVKPHPNEPLPALVRLVGRTDRPASVSVHVEVEKDLHELFLDKPW